MTVDYDFVVDLSNVCRSTALGAPKNGATLGALRVLLPAVSDLIGGTQPVLLLVADKSLWQLLEDSAGRLVVEDWKARNRIHLVEVPYADPSILGYAAASGRPVLSTDNYADWRRSHPWIQGSAGRFFGWRAEPSGAVELVSRTMSVLTDAEASRWEEDREFRDAGFDVERREHVSVLGRMYRCDNHACELRAKNPWFLIGPPRLDRKRKVLICDSCKQPVVDVGEVGPVSQFRYALSNSAGSGRFTIYQGEGTKIGRQTLKANLQDATASDHELLQRVSAEHLTFKAQGAVLMVADLGSTNGTTIQRYEPSTQTLSDPAPLKPLGPVSLGENDILTLAGVVQVRRAGHRFRYDGLTAGEQPDGPRRGRTRAAGSQG